MTTKLIRAGLKVRLKVYAGVLLFYLLYALLSAFSSPTPRMDSLLNWFTWSYEVLGVKIHAVSFLLPGIAAAALLVAEIMLIARDFYGPGASLQFTPPMTGVQLITSRLGLFALSYLLLLALDFPFRWPFYRTLSASITGGEIRSFWPLLAPSDLVYPGILTGVTWVLTFTLVPLLTCLLVATAKYRFGVQASWLPALLALGYGVFVGLCYLFASAMPPLVSLRPDAAAFDTNPLIPLVLLSANVLVFWSGATIIDRYVKTGIPPGQAGPQKG